MRGMTHTTPSEEQAPDPLAFLDAIAKEQAALLTEAQIEHMFAAFAFFRRNKPYCPAPAESPDILGDENDND